jgi:hypothetical protein
VTKTCQKQLKGERIYLGSLFQVSIMVEGREGQGRAAHKLTPGRTVRVRGREEGRERERKRERNVCTVGVLFSLFHSIPSLWDGVHIPMWSFPL